MRYDAYLQNDEGERRVVIVNSRPTQDMFPGWTLRHYGGHFRSLQLLHDECGDTGQLGKSSMICQCGHPFKLTSRGVKYCDWCFVSRGGGRHYG